MFNALFDSVPDAMIVVDERGCIVLANSQAHRLFDYSDGDLPGQQIEALMPPNARQIHEQHRARYMRNPRVRPMGGTGQALTGRRRSGEEFPVEIALSPIDTGEGPHFLASIRDISESQRAKQALVRARYDAVVAQIGQLALESPNEELMIDSLPDLLAATLEVDAVAIVFVPTGRGEPQVRVSSGATDLLTNPLQWTVSLDGPLGDMMAGGQPMVVDDFAVSGTIGPDSLFQSAGMHSGAFVPLFDLHRPMGLLVALSHYRRQFDHDAIHLLQSAANLLAALLQRRRTEEQLAHAQRLDAIGQLTGGIAHDFNNLLTVVSGNLQLLELECSDRPDANQVIDSALKAVGRGAELTAKLLAFARRQHLSPRAIAPRPLLDDLGLMLGRTLGARIQVDIDCPANAPAVFADPSQLDTALINLALNSRDAMPRGGRISIGAREHAVTAEDDLSQLKAGSYVAFAVADTGLGMTPDVLARAFEPFFTTKPAGQGSGLGLSMVYGFVKQSGGHLTVDSRLGYGTRIELFLPAARPDAIVQAPAEMEVPTHGHERILVVEDEPAVREIAVAFLRSLGYDIEAVASADEALAALAVNDDVALLFSDVVLGNGMSGIGLAEEARQLYPHLPVLLTSGYERAALPDNNPAVERFDLLRKPYRREDLATAVRHAIDTSAGVRHSDKT